MLIPTNDSPGAPGPKEVSESKMRHSNKSIETKTTWRLNTAAVLESSKPEKEIRKEIKKPKRRYAILIKILSVITLL